MCTPATDCQLLTPGSAQQEHTYNHETAPPEHFSPDLVPFKITTTAPFNRRFRCLNQALRRRSDSCPPIAAAPALQLPSPPSLPSGLIESLGRTHAPVATVPLGLPTTTPTLLPSSPSCTRADYRTGSGGSSPSSSCLFAALSPRWCSARRRVIGSCRYHRACSWQPTGAKYIVRRWQGGGGQVSHPPTVSHITGA